MNYEDMNEKIKKESEDLEIPNSLHPEQIESMLENQKVSRKPWWKKIHIMAPVLTATAALFIVAVLPNTNHDPGQMPDETKTTKVEETIPSAGAIPTAKSYKELYRAFSSYQERSYKKEMVMEQEMAAADNQKESVSGSALDTSAPSDGSSDFSDTNSQVTGVDEGDIVKTDGNYIYILSADRLSLSIVEAKGTNITPVSKIDLIHDREDSGYSYSQFSEFYLEGDRLVLLQSGGTPMGITFKESEDKTTEDQLDLAYNNYKDTTTISIYDITDRSEPALLNSLSQDGYYGSSRKTDGFLYVFSYYYVYVDESGEKQINTYVPYTNDVAIPTSCIYLPELINSTGYLVVTSIDINNPDGFKDQSAVIASPSSYYVSTEHIYITSLVYNNENSSKSEIMKFAYKDGKITPIADATVPGVINNQFSLDEHNGYLRLVSTVYTSQAVNDMLSKFTWWEPASNSNSLYVLDESLTIVGKIENLAPGEQIYSARFMGDMGYFVTFERVDPLFSVDLADPTNPTIIGELKITGFSSYLHFYKNDLLLGIGFEADPDTGRTTGVKLSMFDIATPSDAQEINKYVMPKASYSPAVYDHKSVLINPDRNIIGFMAQIEENGHMNNTDSEYRFYQEYMTFSYDDKKGFVKNISHIIEMDYYSNYYMDPRGLFIGNYLYIIENENKIVAYDLTTNSQVATWNNEDT